MPLILVPFHPDAHFGREEAGVDGLEGGDGEYSRYVLRLHLPLETNAGCALRVADEMRVWEEGRVWVFCDATEHEAWNRGITTRTILLLDFKNPQCRFRVLNPDLSSEFVEFVEKVRWPGMRLGEKLAWHIWKFTHMGRKPPPAARTV